MILKICLLTINFYQQWLSFDRGLLKLLAPGGACRFNPSCSDYTKEQIIKHGVSRGLMMGVRRVLACR